MTCKIRARLWRRPVYYSLPLMLCFENICYIGVFFLHFVEMTEISMKNVHKLCEYSCCNSMGNAIANFLSGVSITQNYLSIFGVRRQII